MIEHQPDRQRFVLFANGQDSVLEYKLCGNTVNFTHTFVPESLSGKGTAKQLVEHGLTWAREQGYDIEADCWYVDRQLNA